MKKNTAKLMDEFQISLQNYELYLIRLSNKMITSSKCAKQGKSVKI